ncbi:MAG TPA: hypothetical protein VNL39_00690 [Xanthobacteraceae bacterium]|nr:hypothetical protein [Xanthobacteraceae bacterium]
MAVARVVLPAVLKAVRWVFVVESWKAGCSVTVGAKLLAASLHWAAAAAPPVAVTAPAALQEAAQPELVEQRAAVAGLAELPAAARREVAAVRPGEAVVAAQTSGERPFVALPSFPPKRSNLL